MASGVKQFVIDCIIDNLEKYENTLRRINNLSVLEYKLRKEDKMSKITVQNNEINILNKDMGSYISITDMLRSKDGEFFVSDWLRNRNTIEFLGLWESIYNPNFNYGEFAIIRNKAGSNAFTISPKKWIEVQVL